MMLLLLGFTSAMATRQRSQFTRYRSWDSQMYPVWQDGDPKFRNCWSGGEVTFDLKNDAPTLTGAKATFTINLNFPPNQTVLPDGQVVWARNCTVNGSKYQEGQAVYPDRGSEWTGVFPDGTPFNRTQNRKPHYVFVWKTWGRYWQVADGPSSSLTIGTDSIPLGSYNMELVIYHCRGRDRFIPLGYASSVFTITDQVPFSLSLSQVNDVNQNDQNFIQNQAIAFSVAIHDPSQYLNSADISFNWDFGDNTGTLISREHTVTHTYLSVGAFKPQVILMASIPSSCGSPTAASPIVASVAPVVVVVASTPAAALPSPAEGEGATALDVLASDATPLATSDNEEPAADTDTVAVEAASVAPAGVDAAVVSAEQDLADTAAEGDVAQVETEAAAGEVATVPPAAEEPAEVEAAAEDGTAVETAPIVDAAASAAPAVEGEEVADGVADAPTVAPVVVDPSVQEEANGAAETASVAPVVVQDVTEIPAADNLVAAAATEATAAEGAAVDPEAEVLETENTFAATAAAAEATEAEAVPDEGEVQGEVEAEAAQVALVIAKRQAPELTADCTINRYGSLATSVDVVQGIESVEIVQMSNVVSMASELDQNAVDVTISCQGSLPSEVCTVISDADCITPVQTICSAALPSPDCQMILRQFFNDTGMFCLNVSLTNDVSLAVASARVNVAVASGGSPAGTAATVLGVMVLACVVCCIGLMYRRFKQYQPLREDHGADNGGSFVTSMPLLLWNLLSRQSPGESRPLLQGRIV
ncbi:hypothetical protein CHARACLAT_017604 [Characodon lateralis]|uniref:PKD domain-containing protein n=1 Tax=Characodon lateralis TaxID=208331 RepID=A0ABU7CZ44_9TELE|nr:hypothetical protein [Characodon lateralis]